MGIFSSTGRWRRTRPALVVGAALCLAGGISLTVGVGRSAADSATSVTPSSGTSATNKIMITIPAAASCSGDDSGGKNEYQVFPYIIPASKSPESVRYTTGSIQTLSWFTDDSLDSFGFYAPGVGNHSVAQPANLDWKGYQTNGDWNVAGADLQPGTYNVGEMCIDTNSADNPSGAPDIPGNGDSTQNGHTNFWNTQFTFTPKSGDATDFTWTADPNGGATTTTTSTTKPSTSTTTTTLRGQSTTTVAGGRTTTTTASQTGTTTTLVASGTAVTGGSGSAGSSGSGSGPSSDASTPTSDAPNSQLAATGARDLPEQVLLGASLGFGGLFILSFAYPTRRPRSTLGRRG
jgi:hypothetical protein